MLYIKWFTNVQSEKNMVLLPSEIKTGLWKDRGLVKAYLD